MAWRGIQGQTPAWQQQPLQQPQPQQQQQQQPQQPQQAQQQAQRPLGQWAPTSRPTQGPTVQLHTAQKRPGIPGADAGVAPAASPAVAPVVDSYVVYTKGNDSDEVVVRTLVGEYVEHGSNHGRKVYKKLVEKGGEVVDVFLYYWDSRDGPSFEGWWFGNKLGGTQVWSHCTSAALTPPGAGWKIPWDGAVRPTLVVASKAQQALSAFGEKLQQTSTVVSEAEASAKAALEQAVAVLAQQGEPGGLKAAEQLLMPQITILNEALKTLMEAQRGSTGEPARQFSQLGTTLRAVQTAVNAELTKIRQSKAKAEQSEKQRASEEKDMATFQEVLPEAIQKTNAAEDSVEKAVITSEMIAAAGDDLDEVRQAVAQTEQASQEAQKAIGEARIYLNAKQASSRRYESDKAREKAAAELGKLQTQLQEAQNKLNPLKTVRQDFVQRTAAQKLVAEVLEKLSPAEVDVDRAEEATVMLSGEGLTKEMMAQADAAVAKAADHVNSVVQFIETRKKTAAGMAKEELAKMEERCRASQARLQQLKSSHKEAAERVTCETLLREAADKLQSVADTVAKAAEAEGPFLMGVEELPLEDTLTAVKVCETASTSANTAVSIARMFIATKMVEAKRFSAGPSKDAQAKLKEYQTELETHTKKLADLKKATAERKKAATIREAEHEVQKAEDLARKVAKAAAVFEDDAKLFQLSSKDIRAASDETVKAEAVANAALAEARKFLTARQIEAKGKDTSSEVSSELIKYQTRLSTAQAEVGRYKKLSSTVEQRLAAKKVVEEAQSKLKTAEEKVSKVALIVEGLGAEPATAEGAAAGEPVEGGTAAEAEEGGEKGSVVPKTVKDAEQAAAEAQVGLKTLSRFLETQTRVQGMAQTEIAKLQPLVKQAQERLDATVQSMRERSERIVVDGIVKESEDRVKEAEDCVKKVAELEAPFSKDAQELPIDQASSALTELETGVSTAHTAVGGAKTFLAMKRLAAKRLSENSMKATVDQLTELQTRLDNTAKKLSETKKGMAERKLATVKREVSEKVVEVEGKVALALEATNALTAADGTDMAPEDMKGACEKAGSTQQEAQTVLAATRTLLLNRQRDAKNAAVDTSMLGEIGKMLDKLTKIQADLDKQKAALRNQEHRFVAQRLLKDATEMIEKLEKELERTNEIAAPLTSEKEDFKSAIFLSHAMDALRAHMKKASKTAKDIFGELAENGVVSEGKFVAYCQAIPELGENQDTMLSDEQLRSAFSRMNERVSGEVKESDFLDQFRSRYMCTAVVSMTESMAVKGGKTIRKLEVNEIVEALSEPAKDETVGLMRLKCKAEKDEKEGYVTLAGNQGTVYLQAYSPYTACQKRIERAIQECGEAAKETAKYIELKSEELKSVRTGALAETKAELMKMRPRVSKVQYSHSQLKKKIADSEKKMKECIEVERKRRQEAGDRKAAAAIIEEVEALVQSCTTDVDKTVSAAEALASTRGAGQKSPLAAMDSTEKELDALVEAIEKAQAKIKEQMEVVKTSTKGPFSEARSALVKMKVKVGALDSKCKKQIVALKAARKNVANEAHEAAASALRTHFLAKGMKADELFGELSQGKLEITAKSLREFIEKIPDLKLEAATLDVGLERYAAGGLTKLTFSALVQECQRCVKDIAITTSFEVKDSKTIRKLLVGEVVQVMEAERVDSSTGLHRVRCRALADGKEGWVTLRGNQGTSFLEKCSKPYFCCEEETVLQSAFESVSAEVRTLQPGEVLEVVEGPQKEPPLESQRLKGKATKDGKVGWVTLKDSLGSDNFELTKLLVCRQSIAITTTFDIAEGKAMRKLDVGETLEIVEGPKDDSVRSLTRIKARAKSDGKEGWVTMKGNQGTGYMEESDKYYVCKRATGLQKTFATASATIRRLEEGEVFEVTDGPRTETKEGCNRVRGRNLSDGSEGWFTLVGKSMQPWSLQYKCSQSTTMTDELNIKEAKIVRKLEVGETLEALETPVLEKVAGIMRVRVRAEKDGNVGWATVRGNQGTVLLKPMLGEA